MSEHPVHENGNHVIYTNQAGSVHFTRYACGCTDCLVGPDDPVVHEYAPGYLENKAKLDAEYQAGLDFLRNGPPKPRGIFGFLARVFGE